MNPIQKVTWDHEAIKTQVVPGQSAEKFSEMVRRIECKKKLNYAQAALKDSLEPGKEIKISEKKFLVAVPIISRKKHSNDPHDELNRRQVEEGMRVTGNLFDLMMEATSLKISHFRDKEDLLISLLDLLDHLNKKYAGIDLASLHSKHFDMYSQSLEKFKKHFIAPLLIENTCYIKDHAAFTMRRNKIEQAGDYFKTFTKKHRVFLTTEKEKLGYSLLEGIFPLKNVINAVALECLIISPNTLLGIYTLHKDILPLAQLFKFGVIIMERSEVDTLQKMSILHFFLKLCDTNLYPEDKLLEEVQSAFQELKTQCENLKNEEISRIFEEINFYFHVRYTPVLTQELPAPSEEFNRADTNIFLDMIALQGNHYKNWKTFVRATTNEMTFHSAMLIRRLTFTSFIEDEALEFLAITEFSNKLFEYIKQTYSHYADPKNHDVSHPNKRHETFPDPTILLSQFELQHASNADIDPFYLMSFSHLSTTDLHSPRRLEKELDKMPTLSSSPRSPRSEPDTSPSLSPRKESEKTSPERTPEVCLSSAVDVTLSLPPRKESDPMLSSHRKSDTAPVISPRKKPDAASTLSRHRKSDGQPPLPLRKEPDQSLSLPPKKDTEHPHSTLLNRAPRLTNYSFKIEGGPFASSSTSPRRSSKGSDSHSFRRSSKSTSPRLDLSPHSPKDVEPTPMTREDEIRNNIALLFISMAHRLVKNKDFFSAYSIHSAIKTVMDKQIEKIKISEMHRKSKLNEKETEFGKILRKLNELNYLLDSPEYYKGKIKECQKNNCFYNPEIAQMKTSILHGLEHISKSEKTELSKTIPIDFEYIFNISPLILKISAVLENFRFISRQTLKRPVFTSGILKQINDQKL